MERNGSANSPDVNCQMSPEELANLIVFALSDAASFVNGVVLVADNAMDKSYGPPYRPNG
jgi:NAD(P)-dependent dehydrogenase (short-subunit alcohol dehydrogenase family)